MIILGSSFFNQSTALSSAQWMAIKPSNALRRFGHDREISPTTPLIFTGGQKVRNLAVVFNINQI